MKQSIILLVFPLLFPHQTVIIIKDLFALFPIKTDHSLALLSRRGDRAAR